MFSKIYTKSCPPATDPVLKFVFDGRRAKKRQILLNFFVELVQTFLARLQRDGCVVMAILPVFEIGLVHVTDGKTQRPEPFASEFLHSTLKINDHV